MDRPKRTAAQRAKALIAKGYGVAAVDELNATGLSAEEEDFLDEQLALAQYLEHQEDLEVHPPVGTKTGKTSKTYHSYEDVDEEVSTPPFKPMRPPGADLCEHVTRAGAASFTRTIDFFRLFFTVELLEMLVENSNTYAWLHILDKQSYAKYNDGGWEPITMDEMLHFIGLVIFLGLNVYPEITKHWATIPPFSGSLARRYMSRNRFKAMLALLHVSNPDEEKKDDKLSKIRPLIDHFNKVSSRLYQPGKNIAVDERMVKSKGRSGIRQYMPQKPVRFGFKLWCLCESQTGYTLQFDVYTGKRQNPSENGLAYDVVTKLIGGYLQQGYQLWFDNFYTSPALLKHLLANGIVSCGTAVTTRKGMPQALKDKQWPKVSKRGDMRYVREGPILFQQWMDTRMVTICSTMHRGHMYSMAKRNIKDPAGNNRVVYVKKPAAIVDYNLAMGAVDLSDQLIEPYNVLIKSVRWWKILFFHLIDVAIINSYILFNEWRRLHPNEPGLQRPAGYSQLAYREELTKQLAGISDDEPVPTCTNRCPTPTSEYHVAHVPEYVQARRNCKICYIVNGHQFKSNWACLHPKCNMHLCLNAERNCVKLWHSPAFDQYRTLVLESCRHK